MPLTISINNMQKVEFKADPNKCSVSFRNYTAAGGRTLLVTDVPSGAGTMLGAAYSNAFFAQPPNNPAPAAPVPIVFIDYPDTDIVANGAGPNIDLVKYGGRIELREFV
jgi:hypothetical protein